MTDQKNVKLEDAMKEAFSKQVHAWAIMRLLREFRNSRGERSADKFLNEREALTLFLAIKYPQRIRAKSLTTLFGIQYSSAAHIITSLEKGACIKKMKRGDRIEVLDVGHKLLSEYRSREASLWHDVYAEMQLENPLQAYQIQSSRLEKIIDAAETIFSREFFSEPSIQID